MMDGMITMLVLVCAQLGFRSSGRVTDFGAGTGSIFLENVLCSINDTILASCGHYGVGIILGCNHNDDVGVKCDGMLLSLYLHKQCYHYNHNEVHLTQNW